jgi:hypothetical protein
MDILVDLAPKHRVIRLTLTSETLTLELAEDIQRFLSLAALRGGPYASIIDFSRVTSSALSGDAVRDLALRPEFPEGTKVVVAREPSVFGVSRMFQLIRDFIGEQHRVVHSLEDAYDILGVRAEDFTQHIFPKDLAA